MFIEVVQQIFKWKQISTIFSFNDAPTTMFIAKRMPLRTDNIFLKQRLGKYLCIKISDNFPVDQFKIIFTVILYTKILSMN